MENNTNSCEGMNLERILKHYKDMMLTEKTMKRIEEEYKQKEQMWLNEREMN